MLWLLRRIGQNRIGVKGILVRALKLRESRAARQHQQQRRAESDCESRRHDTPLRKPHTQHGPAA